MKSFGKKNLLLQAIFKFCTIKCLLKIYCNALKTALLNAFGKSQLQKDAELIDISGLGDKKPSAFLRYLESLNNDADTLRRAFFLAQLPSQVRAILAAQEFPNLQELALAADRIIEANELLPINSVSALSPRHLKNLQTTTHHSLPSTS